VNPIIYFILLLSSLLAASGQCLFKSGASGAQIMADFINPIIIGGLMCYGASTILWIWALSRAPLLIVYPFTALTFVMVYAGSVLVFGERFSLSGMLGVACVLLGLFIIVTSRA